MFVPATMSQVDIFVFEDNIDAAAQTVAEMGVVHLIDAKTLGQWSTDADTQWVGRANQFTNQERRLTETLEQLDIAIEPAACEGLLDPQHDQRLIEAELSMIEDQVSEIRREEADLQRAQERWALVARSMERLAPLSVTINDLRQLEHLYLRAGTLPSANIARLEAALYRIPYTIIPVHHEKGRSLVFAFCAQTHAPILERALDSAFLDPLALPEDFDGTGRQVLEQVRQRTSENKARLGELAQELQQIADRERDNLLAMLTKIRREETISDAMAHFGHRGHVYLIAGWVPKDRVGDLRQAVEEATDGRATFEENPPNVLGARVRIPTLLRNPGIFKAVEGIVSTYGTPGYRELDPTPLVALTFVTMFGIMFGDLGHGMFLAAVGALLTFVLGRKDGGKRSLGTILLACGASSSIMGLLYGSVFGNEELIPAIWLSPMHDMLDLLLAAIIFGVVILNIGFVCRLASAARAGQFSEAIFDKNGIAGIALYWSIGAIVILTATGRHVPAVLYGLVTIGVLAILLAEPLTRLIKGKRPLVEGNLAEEIVLWAFELLEALIGFVSNTLSYVRLGAFAVAHAGLSMVVIMLADMAGANPLVHIIALVFGNLFVIAFEGAIVAIQTLRLEYYELFGKFYSGQGVPFQPLTLPESDCPCLEESASAVLVTAANKA